MLGKMIIVDLWMTYISSFTLFQQLIIECVSSELKIKCKYIILRHSCIGHPRNEHDLRMWDYQAIPCLVCIAVGVSYKQRSMEIERNIQLSTMFFVE